LSDTELSETPIRPVSKFSPIPLYRQVEIDLRDRIASGEFPPGRRLPSEAELAELYGASRITIRQGLSNLVGDGLIVRESGRGTFVREPTITVGARVPSSFSQELIALNLEPGGSVLRLEIAQPDSEVAAQLRLAGDDRVVILDRLRYGSDAPIGIQRSRLPSSLFPRLERADLTNRSLYAHLESAYGVIPTEAEEVFRAGRIEGEDAALLKVRRGACGLHVERVTFFGPRPFEYVRSVMRGDRYQLRLGLRESGGSSR